MQKTIKRLVGVLLIWFAVHTIYIVADGLNDEQVTADAAVILGSKVNQDGSLSPRLNARIQKGYDLYIAGKVKKLVVSGGVGKEGFEEGTVMGAYLTLLGVPHDDIIIDNAGNNSYLTAVNYKAIAQANNFKSVIVVSQYFHITRTKMIFRKLGMENVSGAHADHFEWRDVYSTAREVPAYYSYWMKY